MRNVLKENASVVLVIHFAAVMFHTIGNNQKTNLQNNIIPGYLVKNLGCDLYARSFILHDHQGLSLSVEQNRIATLGSSVQTNGYFIAQQCARVSLVSDQEVDEMLAHPFFGSQRYVFSA